MKIVRKFHGNKWLLRTAPYPKQRLLPWQSSTYPDPDLFPAFDLLEFPWFGGTCFLAIFKNEKEGKHV